MRTVIALLDGTDEAQATKRELEQLGIDGRNINLVSRERGDSVDQLVEGLVRMGVSRNEALAYADGVQRGYTLETVIVDDDKAEQALRVMQQHTITTPERNQPSPRDAAARTDQAIPIVEEKLDVGRREVQAGGVRVSSHVIEQPVAEEITLRSETVDVERRKVDRAIDPNDAAFEERVVEVVATAEEPVVAKTAHVVEEVIVTKDVDTRTETVRDNVRRTDVNVEKLPAFEGRRYEPHFEQNRQADASFSDYEPAYRYGHELRGSGDTWSEDEARTGWERDRPGTWDRFKAAIRHAWDKATD